MTVADGAHRAAGAWSAREVVERAESTSRCGGDAGAGLTEYALGFALIAVVAVVALTRLDTVSKDEAANQADCISNRPPPPSCIRQPVPAPPSSVPPGDLDDPPPDDPPDP